MPTLLRPGWLVLRNNKQHGPFSAEQLQRAAIAGKLSPDDEVSSQNKLAWVAAGSLSWLFPSTMEQTQVVRPSAVAASDSDHVLDLGNHSEERAGPLSMKGIHIAADFTLSYGDFHLLRKLGAGGMGAVYLALQRSRNRRVAVKMLSSELARRTPFVKRFYREALLLGTLDHLNIVKGYGVGEEAGLPFFAMEYIDGLTVAQVLRKIGQVEVGDAVHIILKAAVGLGCGHSRGVIHRDVTPGNILLTRTGLVKLADFGLAKPTREDVSRDTESDITLGTPRYMAPEQTLNSRHADWRSDIYSLGCVLYQMLTGKLPFAGDTAMELLKAKEGGQFTPARRLNEQVPPRLDLLIDRLLARDPRCRPQNCAELIEKLRDLGLHQEQIKLNPDKLRSEPVHDSISSDHAKLEILMVQAELSEVRLTQEVLKQRRLPAHVYVAGATLNAINYLRRDGHFASAPRPDLIILGHQVTRDSSLTVLDELKAQALSKFPVAVFTDAPDTTWAYFRANHLLDQIFALRPDDRQILGDLFESARDVCLTQAE